MPALTSLLVGGAFMGLNVANQAEQASAMKKERLRQNALQNEALKQQDFNERKRLQQKRAVEANAAMTKDVMSKRVDGQKGAAAGTLLGGDATPLGSTIRSKLY